MTARRTLIVSGGTVVTSSACLAADVLVEDGCIVAVSGHGRLTGDVVVDATDLLVLPGLVDAHVHVRDPGLTHKEDFASGTAAAVAGGVTTVMVMPYDDPLTDSGVHLKEKAAVAEGRVFADFALQAAVGSGNLDAVAELIAAGAVSLEVGLADMPERLAVASSAALRELLRRAADAGTVVGVYCEDDSLVQGRIAELRANGRRDPAAFVEAKHEVGEVAAATLVAALAAETGARVHVRQVSTAGALRAVDWRRERGADLTVEVTPHHLTLTESDQITGGPDLKVSPPLRSRDDVEALRSALASGRIDMVATDHAPHAPEEKKAGADDIWAAPGGFPGLETFLGVMLQVTGGDATTIARTCAEAPARRFGLGDRKGRIAPGFDGDLVLVDPAAAWSPEPGVLRTKARSTPFAGHRLPGRAVCTIVRGHVVVRDGVLVDEPIGRWLAGSGVGR